MSNKILLTGATGFVGRNILPILEKSYDVDTIGRKDGNTYVCDLSTASPELTDDYDIVYHVAGKAHTVPRTEAEAKVFFDVNYQGTVNLCKALEKRKAPKSFIFLSTVAVYGCDYGENITEEHPLDGTTPYALSKKQAEEYLSKWCKERNIKLTILRPSLIAGPNPPGNLGAMIHGIKTGLYASIAGGRAHKSVLMVDDLANIVPLCAAKGGIYNMCDDAQPTFGDLGKLIAHQLGKGKPLNIPSWMATCMAKVGDLLGSKAPINSLKLKKITESLTFSNEKAKRELGWKPLPVMENFKIK